MDDETKRALAKGLVNAKRKDKAGVPRKLAIKLKHARELSLIKAADEPKNPGVQIVFNKVTRENDQLQLSDAVFDEIKMVSVCAAELCQAVGVDIDDPYKKAPTPTPTK